LDKVYISQQQQSNLIHIKRFGINFFRSFSLKNANEMINKLLILIEKIRNDKQQDSSSSNYLQLTKNIIEMIRELEEYSQGELEFEKVFIQSTWNFYEFESKEEIKKLNLPEYLKYAWNRLIHESETISTLLAPISKDKLMKCVRERLILDQIDNLFPRPSGSSLKSLSKDMASLKLLYEMVNGVFGVERLAAEWAAFIKSNGQELMGQGNDFRTIEGIAKFKEEVDLIIRECFQSDQIVQGTLKDAFESIMNGRGERSAELLALYIHNKLQNNNLTEDIESFLSMALLLFRYLHRKEAFDSFYKRTLAQRLLFNGIKDFSIERQFITKLREECGGGFVSRMESMLKDVEQSQEMTKSFKSTDPQLNSGISSVTGITVISGLWPCGSVTGSLTMPSELTRLEGSFSQFYQSQKKNCSLKWTEHLGSCVMRSTFKSGRYNLNLTIPQALVLLKFNSEKESDPPITLTKLLKETQMDLELLEDTLKSLSSPIYPILSNLNGSFRINEDFVYTDESTSARVPLYALQSPFLPVEEEIIGCFRDAKEGEAGVDAVAPMTTSAILDRQYQVDSLLVRKMKQQARLLRNDLINYALANLGNVRVSSNDINGRIEGLIEKEFIKLEEDEETLTYLV
jgi:cullin 4